MKNIDKEQLIQAANMINSKDTEIAYLGCNIVANLTGAEDIQTWYRVNYLNLFKCPNVVDNERFHYDIKSRYFGYIRRILDKQFGILMTYSPYTRKYTLY